MILRYPGLFPRPAPSKTAEAGRIPPYTCENTSPFQPSLFILASLACPSVLPSYNSREIGLVFISSIGCEKVPGLVAKIRKTLVREEKGAA